MVKVGHRKARSGAERPEFTLQSWHHCHSSWTSKPDPSQDWVFYVYICQEINTCWISHLLTVSSLVMGLYPCSAVTSLISDSGAVNVAVWSLYWLGAVTQCEFRHEHETTEGRASWKQVGKLNPRQKVSQGARASTSREGVCSLQECSFRRCIMEHLPLL